MANARLHTDDEETRALVECYLREFDLLEHELWLTTDRALFEWWLGRPVRASYGGAYIFLERPRRHAILINLIRINRARPQALEIVVVEELLHMLDFVQGDNRRHAHHGHDRIARRVAMVTGASMEDIRCCLIPARRRPPRYVYACPECGVRVPRRKRGTWSCRRCAPHFDPRLILQLIVDCPEGLGQED
ncbi:MAG: hypothetical protein M3R06_00225 [Chloroflexota bacterium]|nr:hypothetical protein [Chloroflexota bacterium]